MKPSNDAIARAFWHELGSAFMDGAPISDFTDAVLRTAERFNSEAAGSVLPNVGEVMQIETLGIQGERPVARGKDGKASPHSDAMQWGSALGKRACDRLAAESKRTCPRPTCRAEMRPGLHCGNAQCPLRSPK